MKFEIKSSLDSHGFKDEITNVFIKILQTRLGRCEQRLEDAAIIMNRDMQKASRNPQNSTGFLLSLQKESDLQKSLS